jgi:predicted dehydrogenase
VKVLVIGLGSMGKRRTRLLMKGFTDIEVYGVDFSEKRREEALTVGILKTYPSVDEAVLDERPDACFVCTAPTSHHKIISTCLDFGLHVFTELNLISDQYEELVKKASERNLTLFLSSTMLYRKDLEYIISSTKNKKVNYIYHSGQYLPDWHPWENYKDFFVNDIRSNACREIFAIDLPWILSAMGQVENFTVSKGKISELEVNYNDYYFVTFEHASGSTGSVCVDVVSRKPTRRLVVFSEDLYIVWEGTPNSLQILNLDTKQFEQIQTYEEIQKDQRYSDNIIENAYTDEILTFFGVIKGKDVARYSFMDDLKTLKLIDEIEGKQS